MGSYARVSFGIGRPQIAVPKPKNAALMIASRSTEYPSARRARAPVNGTCSAFN
ncbi:MAG TPA: hypothetical protein VEP50_08220 [bacterium]|nr:hypothetical protein [bacterium]